LSNLKIDYWVQMGTDLKNRKKRKSKKVYRYWLSANLAAAIVVLILLLCRPAGYNRPDIASVGNKRQVSQYLTHELLPQLYNGAQRQEPFELRISQNGINEVISEPNWFEESGGAGFLAPAVVFAPDEIVLMGTTNIKGVELVVTIVVEPALDRDGLLNLSVTKVKIGAVNITPVAKMMAKRMYSERLAELDTDREDLQGQIAAALLNDEPFEPVFKIEDKKVRAEKITIGRGKLAIRLVPAPQ
jgi:hypothetical protein